MSNNYTDQEIAGFVERRRREIFEIESLWTRLTVLRGDTVKSFSPLDAFINEYFQVIYGRDSLAFESIAELKRHLESEIEKAEKSEPAKALPKIEIPKTLLALSVRQPWAHAILRYGKDIENRDWTTTFRGTIAVHASNSLRKDEIDAFCFFAGDILSEKDWKEFRVKTDFPTGAIVGTVEIADCVKSHSSGWFTGDYGFVLKNPMPLKNPIRIGGKLKFWEVPQEIKEQIFNQLGETK